MTTSSDVIIRRASTADETAIARLWQALSDEHVRLDVRLPVPVAGAAHHYAARLVETLDDPMTRTFVAEAGGRVVAYILGAVIDLQPDLFEYVETGFIADVYVEPGYRRQGIARALVQTLNDWFAAQGVRHTEWQVAAANPAAVHFWEAVGGRPVTVRMRVELDPAVK